MLASTPFSRWNKRSYASACACVASENQALHYAIYDEIIYEMDHIWTADTKSSEAMILAVMNAILAIA